MKLVDFKFVVTSTFMVRVYYTEGQVMAIKAEQSDKRKPHKLKTTVKNVIQKTYLTCLFDLWKVMFPPLLFFDDVLKSSTSFFTHSSTFS